MINLYKNDTNICCYRIINAPGPLQIHTNGFENFSMFSIDFQKIVESFVLKTPFIKKVIKISMIIIAIGSLQPNALQNVNPLSPSIHSNSANKENKNRTAFIHLLNLHCYSTILEYVAKFTGSLYSK